MSADKNDEYLSDGNDRGIDQCAVESAGIAACRDEHPVLRSRAKTKRTSFVKSAISCTWARCWKEACAKPAIKLRVTAQLINVSDGYHLWSKDYDGDVKDILNFQSNVAEQVVQALQVKLGGEGTRVLAKKPTENPELTDSICWGATSR